MARNKTINDQIEWLGKEADLYDMQGLTPDMEYADKLYRVKIMLEKIRDTLISIALCRNGIASHQAQDTLIAMGLCDHAKQVYRASVDVNIEIHLKADPTGEWRCPCGRSDPQKIGAYL